MKLFGLSNSKSFAEKISAHLNIPLGKVDTETFADGEVNVTFEESVRNETIVIVAQLQMPYSNLMELIFMCDAAKRCDVKEINVIIPYLPHSRQERRGDKRSAISARVIADMLQNAGVNHIISMDLHIAAIEGFYKIPFEKLYPTNIFVEKIKSLAIPDMCLVSPDFGFMKKMEIYKDQLNVDMAVINKKRVAANSIESMELIGDVNGKNVIIIDDIIDTAGTLVKASDLLLSKGAQSVTVFATHGVLSGTYQYESKANAISRIAASKIKKVYISNTYNKLIEIDYASDFVNKIEVVDVSSEFAKSILKINTR